MRITKVTPLSEARSDPNVELYVGEYDDWKDEWHRAEILELQAELPNYKHHALHPGGHSYGQGGDQPAR